MNNNSKNYNYIQKNVRFSGTIMIINEKENEIIKQTDSDLLHLWTFKTPNKKDIGLKTTSLYFNYLII